MSDQLRYKAIIKEWLLKFNVGTQYPVIHKRLFYINKVILLMLNYLFRPTINQENWSHLWSHLGHELDVFKYY